MSLASRAYNELFQNAFILKSNDIRKLLAILTNFTSSIANDMV